VSGPGPDPRSGDGQLRALLGQFLSGLILLLASGLGLWAFLFPFFLPPAGVAAGVVRGQAHAEDAPFIFLILLGLCLVVIIAKLETGALDARLVAVLGVLVGINATLRLLPEPGGFSAMFLLPILAGYVFGPAFGFLLGAFSLLASAIITSGVGPWLPFQMFATGWVGTVGGWLPRLSRPERAAVWLLAAWGLVSGFLYGGIMNLWFWPYLLPPEGGADPTGWQPGLNLAATLTRYGLFYLTTSLWWDAGRALGNLLLILFLGRPVLRLLWRFRRRFRFEVVDH